MRVLLLTLLLALSACSTKPVVTDVSGPDVKTIPGIPFRLTADQTVSIYRLEDDKDEYKLVSETNQRLADQRRLYAISIKGDTFATRSLHVVLNGDNTLSKVELSSSDTSGAVVDSLTGALAAKTTADNAKKAAGLTNANAILAADKAVADAQAALDALPATTTAETRALYEQILASAKQAAAAARAAGGK
jgi:hypothetical protein